MKWILIVLVLMSMNCFRDTRASMEASRQFEAQRRAAKAERRAAEVRRRDEIIRRGEETQRKNKEWLEEYHRKEREKRRLRPRPGKQCRFTYDARVAEFLASAVRYEVLSRAKDLDGIYELKESGEIFSVKKGVVCRVIQTTKLGHREFVEFRILTGWHKGRAAWSVDYAIDCSPPK